MGASPELFREVDGRRIAAVSSFSSKALRWRHQVVRVNYCLPSGRGVSLGVRWTMSFKTTQWQAFVARAAKQSLFGWIRESNNGFCSEIFEYAWQRRVTRSPLTGQIETKRLRTNQNIASHNCARDSVPASRETYFTFAPNFAQDFGKSLRPRTCWHSLLRHRQARCRV